MTDSNNDASALQELASAIRQQAEAINRQATATEAQTRAVGQLIAILAEEQGIDEPASAPAATYLSGAPR